MRLMSQDSVVAIVEATVYVWAMHCEGELGSDLMENSGHIGIGYCSLAPWAVNLAWPLRCRVVNLSHGRWCVIPW